MKSPNLSYQETSPSIEEENRKVSDTPGLKYTENHDSDTNLTDDLRFRTFIRSSVLRKKPSPEILKAIKSNIQSC